MAHRRAAALAAIVCLTVSLAQPFDADVLVYGGTPGGIQAALAAANEGLTVILATPMPLLGGMMTGGLGATDTGNTTAIGGAALAFFQAVCAAYGKPVPPAGGCWDFEPHVAGAIFDALVAAAPRVAVRLNATLVRATVASGRVTSVALAATAAAEAAGTAAALRALPAADVAARVFIDASYEGDLLDAAGVATAVGREGREAYNESHAGVLAEPSAFGQHQFNVFVDAVNHTTGAPLPGVSGDPPGAVGAGDAKVQAFNFRLCMTRNASNLRPFPRPPSYDAGDWEIARRFLAAANVTRFTSLMNLVPIPGAKTDTNNNGPVSTDIIGGSWAWPRGTPAARRAVFDAHVRYTLGFFWFLQTDAGVPPPVQAEARTWGLAADEFVATGGVPPQLYVREGRRLVGDFVFTQRDRQTNVSKADSIGLFSYNIDSHHAQRYVDARGGAMNEGDFELYGGPLGQIPYRALLPPRGSVGNVLAPVPLSASHMGYGCLRLEPQLMVIGQAAGVAAAHAVSAGVDVQDVDVPALQARLRALGAKVDLPAH